MNVRFGCDVLVEDRLDLLEGKRVGLITNHTGFNKNQELTADVLAESPRVNLTALFGPEHGIRGESDHARIEDEVDAKTGVKVFSLYGETREPTPEMLEGVDALVYDIQDVGARFYTYISTLSHAMKAAGENGVEMIVLDRPNPVGGVAVEGPILDSEFRSFVGAHEIAMRHGMTVGECALLFAAEFGRDCNLTVVPCEGWTRGMLMWDTKLPYVGPSPNLHTVEQAILYTGPCLMESSNLSMARGTDIPFEAVGAPWVEAEEVLEAVRACGVEHVAFETVAFTPEPGTIYPYAGVECHGVRMRLTDPYAFRSLPLGVALLTAFRDECDEFEPNRSGFERLCGSRKFIEAFYAGAGYAEMLGIADEGVERFERLRGPHLMYPM